MTTLLSEKYGMLSGPIRADKNSSPDERMNIPLRVAVGGALLGGVERHLSPGGWMNIKSAVRCVLSVAAVMAYSSETCDRAREARRT